MLSVIKKGDKDIPSVTDADRPNRLGKKRAQRIRQAFNLDKKLDDVRKYVIHRKIEKKVKDKDGNEHERTFYKAPKIQRLITEKRIRRKKLIKDDRVNRYKTSKEQCRSMRSSSLSTSRRRRPLSMRPGKPLKRLSLQLPPPSECPPPGLLTDRV